MSWDWEELKKQQQAKRDIIDHPKKPFKIKPFKIKPWMGVSAYIVLAIILIVICWNVGRWINYKFSYEPQMKQAIIEMVKPEALKDQYRKEEPDGTKKM